MNFKMPSNQEFEQRLAQMNKTQFAVRYLEFTRDVIISEINKILNQTNSKQDKEQLKSKTIKISLSEGGTIKPSNDFDNQVSATVFNQKAA